MDQKVGEPALLLPLYVKPTFYMRSELYTGYEKEKNTHRLEL